MPKKPIFFALIASVCASAACSFAQTNTLVPPTFQEYHPTWGVIPDVKRPAFDYSEVHTGKLVGEAGENLNFLPVDNFVVGRVRGYQVISPTGEVTYLNKINNPTCALTIVGQQVRQDGQVIGQISAPISSAYIGEINFDGC